MRNMQTIFTPNGNNCQKVAFLTASAVSSAALTDQCYAVELYSTQDVYISQDEPVEITGTVSAPVTSGLSYFLPASILKTISVSGKAALSIQGATADGTLHINELTS